MRLVSLRLTGYRRFLDARVSLDAPVVAIVGPNQAGKSSLLSALRALETDDPISERDLTRSAPPAPGSVVIEARYRLDAEAIQALADHGISKPPLFLIERKKHEGSLEYTTEPPLVRDRALRLRTVPRLRKASQSLWAKGLAAIETAPRPETPEGVSTSTPAEARISELAVALDSKAESLPTSTLDLIDQVRDHLAGGGGNSKREELRNSLAALSLTERELHPSRVATKLLQDHVPSYLDFGSGARMLEPEYDFATLDLTEPPDALVNLCSVAGLDLGALQGILSTTDPAETVNLLDPANATLASVFGQFWTRAKFSLRLERDGSRLHILTDRKPGKWASIAESSDGMRAFVALMVFAHQNPSTPRPVLLVDEAETHLHYEAQADLVRVFESQDAAGQVIYTTHSAGCLPQDLGRGVRVVGRIPETDTSEIRSSFWTLGPGFSPLVIAMGASALAFTPTRFEVIGEGGSETLLLPTLLREATGLERLAFQVAPGLANASFAQLKELGLEAARVAYLVDSDQSGRDKRAAYLAEGIPPKLVVFLGASSTSNFAIEDFLDEEVYLAAVNLESAGRHDPAYEIPSGQLPRRGRAKWVKARHAAKRLPTLSKTEVAARALDIAVGRLLSDPTRHKTLRAVHGKLLAALGVDETT
ncbi:MAG: AAA family ATPase [Chloroflexi bacterium]|nr:AAA family ATPase [Chloroflexota bacterium]